MTDPLDIVRLVRSMIEHEDTLINYRITWLLVFQGFLFTAFVSSLNLLKDPTILSKRMIGAVVLAILVIGALSPVLPAIGVIGAETQIQDLVSWCESHCAKSVPFPPLVGKIASGHGGLAIFGLSLVWLILLGLFLRGVRASSEIRKGQ